MTNPLGEVNHNTPMVGPMNQFHAGGRVGKRLTPLKAIRAKCLECAGGSWAEVRRCNIPDCSLFEYRFGSNPARKGRRLPHDHPFLKK
jgi:hypothetical protein